MQDKKIISPPGIQTQRQYMLKEQEVLNQKRLELVNQLRYDAKNNWKSVVKVIVIICGSNWQNL